MRSWTRWTLAAGLALAVSACGGGDANREADGAAAGNRNAAVGTAGTGNADAEFVNEQLALGEAEVEMGRLAQQRGSHPAVKRYGEMMERDHRSAGEELRRIAGNAPAGDEARGDRGPAASPTAAERGGTAMRHGSEHAEVREELEKLSGREFDRRYIEHMIEDHERAISEVETRVERAESPEVRAWAAKVLPKMRQHLEEAQNIRKTLESDRGDRNDARK